MSRRRSITTEREIVTTGARVRLTLAPAGEGMLEVVEAYKLTPGAERWRRARHLELTAPAEQYHLDEGTLASLEALR